MKRKIRKTGLPALALALCLLLPLPALADGEDETELGDGFVPIGIGVTQPDPEPAKEPEDPASDPEPEASDPETGNENETEMSDAFVPIGVGVTQPGQGSAPETGNAAAVNFSDVAAGKWYAEAVIEAASKGIMNGMGDGTFAPQANLTRAMLAQILYNLEGRPAASGGAPFGDVDAGDWFAPAVAWAAGEKLVEGWGGNYAPLADVTREQLVTVLWRYARWKGAAAAAGGSLEAFADRGEVSSWAAEAVGWAVGVGLLKGRSADTLAPRGEATRAEVATLMLRFTALTDK